MARVKMTKPKLPMYLQGDSVRQELIHIFDRLSHEVGDDGGPCLDTIDGWIDRLVAKYKAKLKAKKLKVIYRGWDCNRDPDPEGVIFLCEDRKQCQSECWKINGKSCRPVLVVAGVRKKT